ncbi:MAG: succinylglutamate desuccinylase/aspartoacylase family protein [Gemmatimonadetes bacterium]|nr:succinylglutamate desuccinylase/aspartoacylase family protein [Gemmatimonadota bacterium]
MDSLVIGATEIRRGERKRIDIPLAEIPGTQVIMPMPVEVINGRKKGPVVWVSGVVHGDELNGIDIIRQVLERVTVDNLRGTLIAVPIVNMFGFVTASRYLPDRRDLNRSFPGSGRGSLASRLANAFMKQIVAPCTHGIDLHTGSDHRRNLPQIRADLTDPEARACALAFAAPVTIDSHTRDGSLRDAAGQLGKHVLLYEAGEPHRFNRDAVKTGVRGTLAVMAHLGMLEPNGEPAPPTTIATKSQWYRAKSSGLARLKVSLGDRVKEGQKLAVVCDAFGSDSHIISAPCEGVVIGRAGNPVVRRGDALVHVATQFE